MDAEREVVDVGTLATEIEDTDLRIGDTTVESGLGIRLEIRNVSISFFPIFIYDRRCLRDSRSMCRRRSRSG